MCAGAMIFMANKMQRPRTRGFPTMPPNKDEVFANTIEFVRYHREASIRSWDDDTQTDSAKMQRELIRRGAEATGQSIIDYAARSGRRPPRDPNLQNIPIRSRLSNNKKR